MAKITISYRREDSGVIVGRIFDRLVAHYGTGTVFRDIDNIPPGIDFRKYINEALGSTDILLAIIGPDWAGRTPDGRTRIAEPTDLVRIEVEVALQKEVPVVPVLVAKATMPQPSELPEALQDFAYRHAIRVDAFEDFDDHLRRLIRSLDRLLHSTRAPPPRLEILQGAEQERDEAVGNVTALSAKMDDPQRADSKVDPQAPPPLIPKPRERLSSEQPKTTAVGVPWRIIAGSVIILGVIAVVAVLSLRPPAAPQAEPPLTSQDAGAINRIGDDYYNGQGVAQDYGKAREWYEKAAAKGNATAMANLGALYDDGRGVAQDYGKAREWYEKAAAQGNVAAMRNLGSLYDNGQGVAQDHGKAREWYEKAAAKATADAKEGNR